MNLVLALALLAAPGPAGNSPEDCDKLWDATVMAAAPDLDPSDDLRKGYLAHERAQLTQKCRASGPEVLACPTAATQVCSKKFPQPPDGGRALGLATCVYPEVQRCAQESFIQQAAATGSVASLLADLDAGKVAPDGGGLIKLTGDRALLSLRGEALAERQGKGFWLVLITRRAGAHIGGVLLKSPAGANLPQPGALSVAGLHAYLLHNLAAGALLSTDKP